MRVQFSRPHQGGGAMASIISDTKVVEILPTINIETNAEIAPVVPEGAIQVDDNMPVHDWQISMPAFGRPE